MDRPSKLSSAHLHAVFVVISQVDGVQVWLQKWIKLFLDSASQHDCTSGGFALFGSWPSHHSQTPQKVVRCVECDSMASSQTAQTLQKCSRHRENVNCVCNQRGLLGPAQLADALHSDSATLHARSTVSWNRLHLHPLSVDASRMKKRMVPPQTEPKEQLHKHLHKHLLLPRRPAKKAGKARRGAGRTSSSGRRSGLRKPRRMPPERLNGSS